MHPHKRYLHTGISLLLVFAFFCSTADVFVASAWAKRPKAVKNNETEVTEAVNNISLGLFSLGTKLINEAFILTGSNLAKTSPAKAIAPGVYDKVSQAASDFFTAGFGMAEIMPDDMNKTKYWIAGYRAYNAAQGVLDPMTARAVWIDDNSGKGGVVFVSVDDIGMLSKDVTAAKAMLADFVKRTGCRSINILSTHNHASIDTIGVWGPLPFSGRNEKYMQIVFNGIKTAVEKAYADKRKGSLYLGSTDVQDIHKDTRLPEVFSKTMTRLRFVPEDGSREIYFINFASHSESLKSENSLVSADVPCYMREEIKRRTGAETIYFVGAIGGLIRLTALDENSVLSTKKAGVILADYATSIQEEKRLSPKISVFKQEFYLETQNTALLSSQRLGILKADKYAIKTNNYAGYALKTEMTFMEIDSLKMLLIPGEIFPELVYGGYLSDGESATGKGPEINPTPLAEIAEDKNLMIFGLSNDEIGYIVTPNDFFLNPSTPYFYEGIDRLGRRHYEETNSLGPNTAYKIAEVFTGIMEKVKAAD